MLLVHAHPDDETINNGATMAKYAAEGALVTLVTCTLGEEGEVIPPVLAHLVGAEGDPLAEHRREELRGAMEGLWVTHRVVDTSVVPVQSRALECHATQVVVVVGWYSLSNHVVSRLAGR
jgi:LmbE family N-acetylglucosaminyl deacetylase